MIIAHELGLIHWLVVAGAVVALALAVAVVVFAFFAVAVYACLEFVEPGVLLKLFIINLVHDRKRVENVFNEDVVDPGQCQDYGGSSPNEGYCCCQNPQELL